MDKLRIAVFQKKEIRKIIYKDEWWFSVIDVCGALTDSRDAGAYWRKLKQRLKSEGSEIVTNCHGLKLEASDGKKYKADCANTEEYIKDMRRCDKELSKGWGQIAIPLSIKTSGNFLTEPESKKN